MPSLREMDPCRCHTSGTFSRSPMWPMPDRPSSASPTMGRLNKKPNMRSVPYTSDSDRRPASHFPVAWRCFPTLLVAKLQRLEMDHERQPRTPSESDQTQTFSFPNAAGGGWPSPIPVRSPLFRRAPGGPSRLNVVASRPRRSAGRRQNKRPADGRLSPAVGPHRLAASARHRRGASRPSGNNTMTSCGKFANCRATPLLTSQPHRPGANGSPGWQADSAQNRVETLAG